MSLPNISSIKSGNTLDLEALMQILTDTIGTYDLVNIVGLDGWIADTNTWTYASAGANYGTFTISGDYSSRYYPGMKVKYTQTTLKFGVITSVSYSAPNTTIRITGGTDYVLANAAISSPYYSVADQPNQYPGSFDDNSVTPTGFSSVGTWYCRLATHGRLATVMFLHSAPGTSNATSYTVPLTITAATKLVTYVAKGTGTDNGAYQNNVLASISSGGSVINLSTQGGSANWTASGNKAANFTIIHEF